MKLELKTINQQVLRLALPSILANITIPLVGIVDTAIAGHIADASAIGGIAVGTMLFDLLYWNFGFLRIGTAGLTAQAWGREHGDSEKYRRGDDGLCAECYDILSQSLSIALWAAIAILLLQWFFVSAVLFCMPCSEEVASFARQYFYIRVWAAPATLSLMAFKGWFIGMQNTVAPMITDIVVNVVNIVASYLLAVYSPLGALGVAWGTLIAQYSGLVVAIVILLCRYRLPKLIYRLRELRQTLRTQLSSFYGQLFIRSVCFMIVYVGYTVIASSYGDTELAISSILMKLFMFFSYFSDGFAYAGEALTGRSIGEKNSSMLTLSVRVLFVWAIVIGVAFSLIYGMAHEGLIRLMTSDEATIMAAAPYTLYLAAMPLLSSLAFMWDGIYVGAASGKHLRNSMIWSAVGFLLTYLASYKWLGMHALYVAYIVHLVVRAMYLSVCWKTARGQIESV